MASHRIRMQVQQGTRQEIASKTYNEDSPCSKYQAKQLLDTLESEASRFYSDSDWRRALSGAIHSAKDWVSRAYSMDAQGGSRNVYSESFSYSGNNYRVDIEINAGSEHFS